MPRRGQRRPRGVPGDKRDPAGLTALVVAHLEWLRVRGYSERTVEGREYHLAAFVTWCADRGVARAVEVTRAVVERYQRWLFMYRNAKGKGLSFRSQHGRLVPLRSFFKWASREHHVLYNPAADIELPKLEKRLPRAILTAHEAEEVINVPNVKEPLGVRDRAILETLYSTGIRRMELCNLKVQDVDVERGTLMVRQGKGKKDRMIPISERALQWVDKYVADIRPGYALEPDEGTLFLTIEGESFTPNRLTQLVRNHIEASGVAKRGSCHLFRHTMATLMLEGGADIRFIQAMLGHAELSTTEIYTQVSIRKLKEIHTATHPGARQGPPAGAVVEDLVEPAPEPTAQDVLTRLDDEEAEEMTS